MADNSSNVSPHGNNGDTTPPAGMDPAVWAQILQDITTSLERWISTLCTKASCKVLEHPTSLGNSTLPVGIYERLPGKSPYEEGAPGFCHWTSYFYQSKLKLPVIIVEMKI